MSIDLLLYTTELFLCVAILTMLLGSIWLMRELCQPWLLSRIHKARPRAERRVRAWHDEDTMRVIAHR